MTAAITTSRRHGPTGPACPSPLLRAFTGLLCAAIALSPLPAVASSPATFGMFAPAAAPAPAAAGNTVGLFRLTGDPTMADNLRSQIVTDMSDAGYTVRGVALDIEAAATKAKCKGGAAACMGKIVEWVNKTAAKSGAGYNYLIYGDVGAGPGARGSIVIYDVAARAPVKEFTPTYNPDDLIMALALPRAMVATLNNHRTPEPPITPEEEKVIAELDEPGKTPEELRAEADAIREARDSVTTGQGEVIDTSNIKVDLKKDFKDFCRKGPAKPRASRDDPKDMRPVCKRGPFFGYWQTRAWVALGLTAGALVTTGVFYSLGLAARGPYKSALSELQASGLQPTNTLESDAYTVAASDVADKGNTMRNRMIGGDVALLTSVLLLGVLGVIIYQDRSDAKAYIREEKALASAPIQNFRAGPIFTRHTQGAGFSFNF